MTDSLGVHILETLQDLDHDSGHFDFRDVLLRCDLDKIVRNSISVASLLFSYGFASNNDH